MPTPSSTSATPVAMVVAATAPVRVIAVVAPVALSPGPPSRSSPIAIIMVIFAPKSIPISTRSAIVATFGPAMGTSAEIHWSLTRYTSGAVATPPRNPR